MTVAVYQPPQKPQKDNLDILQQALGIATGVYGVANEKNKTDAIIEQNRLKQQQETDQLTAKGNEEARKARGELNQGEIDNYVRGGGEIAPNKPPQIGADAEGPPVIGQQPPGFGRIGQDAQGNPIFGRKKVDDAGKADKDAKLVDDLGKALEKDINPNSTTRSGIKQYKEKIDAADRLKGLYTNFASGNVRDLSQQQMQEMAINSNFMLSNGHVTDSGTKALVPETARASAAGMQQWLFGEPTGVGQQAFIKQMADTTERERQIAEDQLKSAQVAVLPAHNLLKNKSQDQFNAIYLSQGIDPKTDIDSKGHYIRKSPIYQTNPGGAQSPGGDPELNALLQEKARRAALKNQGTVSQ